MSEAMQAAFQAAGYVAPAARLRTVARDVLADHPANWVSTEMVCPGSRNDANYPKLREIAVAALVKSKNNWDAAKDAVFAAVRTDAALLWALFEPYRSVAVQKLLHDVAQEMRAAAQQEEMAKRRYVVEPAGGGQWRNGNHDIDAPTRNALRPDEGSQVWHEHRWGDAPRPVAAIPRAAANAAAVATVQKTILDTFLINGQAIGDCTVQEANGWATSRARDVRFVRLLTANLPHDAPIRKYRTGEDAQKIYQRAEELTNAA